MRHVLFGIWMVAGLGLVACDDKGDDTGTGTADTAGGDGGATDDGGATGDGGATDCNTDNEDCAPGTCGGEGRDMLPGSDCIACHSPGNLGEEDEANKWWSAAGTVFTDLYGTSGQSGAIVRITDAEGTTVELTTSSSGNFYTSDDLVPPLSAEIELDGNVISMATTVDTGACNACHKCDGSAGGKLHP